MEKYTFSIPNISCGHCTMAIEKELGDMEGVTRVAGDVDNKTVTVQWDAPASKDNIVNMLKEINYPPTL